MGPFSPESLATSPNRTTTNRNNAYTQPLAYKALAAGLPSFDTRGCTRASPPPSTRKRPRTRPSERAPSEDNEKAKSTKFFDLLKKYAFAEQTDSATVPAPGCTQRGRSSRSAAGPATTYQHTFEQE